MNSGSVLQDSLLQVRGNTCVQHVVMLVGQDINKCFFHVVGKLCFGVLLHRLRLLNDGAASASRVIASAAKQPPKNPHKVIVPLSRANISIRMSSSVLIFMHNFHGIDDCVHYHRFRRKKTINYIGDDGGENHAGNEEEDFVSLLFRGCGSLGFHAERDKLVYFN